MVVDTLGGRMHVRWDSGAAATPHGQLVFFAEFLAATGVFERWVSACPLEYRSGNAPDKRDVLGTLMLGMLAGHRRYAHITALRGDAVAAQALGMHKIVSEDALSRALERIDEPASTAWMRPALMHSVREALDRPWVLDIDASIKPLYGRQEGAEIGYNTTKPMRPSHVLHTFWMGNLRLVLDAQVSSGKQHTSVCAKSAFARLLDELGAGPEGGRPALVRGDSGYGDEGILVELESGGQPYLLRVRQTANVQRLVAQQFALQDWSRPDNQGCQMVEDWLQLHGWSKKRHRPWRQCSSHHHFAGTAGISASDRGLTSTIAAKRQPRQPRQSLAKPVSASARASGSPAWRRRLSLDSRQGALTDLRLGCSATALPGRQRRWQGQPTTVLVRPCLRKCRSVTAVDALGTHQTIVVQPNLD